MTRDQYSFIFMKELIEKYKFDKKSAHGEFLCWTEDYLPDEFLDPIYDVAEVISYYYE